MARVDWPAPGDTVSLAGAVDPFPEIAEQPWRESSLARWLKARRNALSTKLAADTLRVVDFCTTVATGWIALLLYSPVQFDAWSHYSLVAVLGGVLLVNLMQMNGVYHPDRIRAPLSHLPATAKAILLTAAAFTTAERWPLSTASSRITPRPEHLLLAAASPAQEYSRSPAALFRETRHPAIRPTVAAFTTAVR